MKIYLAATIQNGFYLGTPTYNRLDEVEKGVITYHSLHRLDSYHYIGTDQMAEKVRLAGLKVFLDSGAFSAFTKGAEIDIKRYIDWIKRHKDILEVYSVLDAIGDADKTWANQRTMEQAGVQPLPCFHYGEDPAVLEHYAANYPYITIGGMVPISNSQLVHWLDHLWERHLCNKDGSVRTAVDGKPLRVHGFGLTSKMLMERYPWWSVDSSSWVQVGGMGNLFTTEYGTIPISDASPRAKEFHSHFDNLRPQEKEAVRSLIESRGFKVERLRVNHLSRKTFNAASYMRMSHMMRDKALRYVRAQPVLF